MPAARMAAAISMAAEQAMEQWRARTQLGQKIDHAWCSQELASIALLAGRPERAEPALRAGADVLEKAGGRSGLSGVAYFLAQVLYRLGRFDEAEEWAERAEQTTLAEDVVGQAWWRSVRALVLASRGEAEESLRLSAEAIDLLHRTDGVVFIGDALAARAEVLQMLGNRDEARPVLEEALAVYERKGIVPSIQRTRALLAESPTS